MLCIDLFCGLGGWTEGFLAEDWRVIGFDIEARPYPAQLVRQDVLTIHGNQFRNADCIVASPPCQNYSYMAMPWKRGKAIAAEIRSEICGECRGRGYLDYGEGLGSCNTCHGTGRDALRLTKLNALFDACFRIQREASEAAGRYIPMVVENVKGAQPWVGPARANFGSFYLWGDVDSIGGRIVRRGDIRWGAASVKAAGRQLKGFSGTWFHDAELGTSNPNRNRTTVSPYKAIKNDGGSWFNIGSRGQTNVAQNPVRRKTSGIKQGGEWWWHDPESMTCRFSSASPGRKAASAQIAKIPFELARHIAQIFKPCISAQCCDTIRSDE